MIYKTDCIYGGLVTVYELVKRESSKTIIFTEVNFFCWWLHIYAALMVYRRYIYGRTNTYITALRKYVIHRKRKKRECSGERCEPRSAVPRLVVQVAMFQASHGLFSFRPHSVLWSAVANIPSGYIFITFFSFIWWLSQWNSEKQERVIYDEDTDGGKHLALSLKGGGGDPILWWDLAPGPEW